MECICIPTIIPIGAVNEANAIPLAPVDVAATMTTAHILDADVAEESPGGEDPEPRRFPSPSSARGFDNARRVDEDKKKDSRAQPNPIIKPTSVLGATSEAVPHDRALQQLQTEMIEYRQRESQRRNPVHIPLAAQIDDTNPVRMFALRMWLAVLLLAFLTAVIQKL